MKIKRILAALLAVVCVLSFVPAAAAKAAKIDVLVNGKKAALKKTTDKECKVTASIEKGYTIKKLEYSYAGFTTS